MKDNTAIESYKGTSSTRMLVAMVGIGVLCAMLIVLTFAGTKTRIETLQEQALQAAIFKVVPGITSTKVFVLNSAGKFVQSETEEGIGVYAGYDEAGDLVGIAIEARGQGYADMIRILYGYDPTNEKVIGFYVLESKETPGLGDKIEKDETFLANFEALDVRLNSARDGLENRVVTVKSGAKVNPWEVDGITGATISSRAIGDIIASSSNKLLPAIQANLEAFQIRE